MEATTVSATDQIDVGGAKLAQNELEKLALGSDLVVQRVQRQVIGLQAEVEIQPAAEPTAVMVALLEAVERYLSPRAEFQALAQAEAAGVQRSDLVWVLGSVPARQGDHDGDHRSQQCFPRDYAR